MGALASGCLDEPPTYSAPVQSPPIVLGNQVSPSTVKPQTIPLNSPPPTLVPLKVPFRSIDAGEPLVAIFWLDLDPLDSQTERNSHLLFAPTLPADARPLDEQDRAVTFDFDATNRAGCHTVTMHLAHESTYPNDPEHGINDPGKLPPTNQFDIAQVTWFFDIRDPTRSQPVCWGGQ
jgi:hypothetical protein